MKRSKHKEKEIEPQEIKEWMDWDRKENITVQEVMNEKDMADLSPEQAEEVVLFVKGFSVLLYDLLLKEQNQQATIIDLNKNNNKQRKAA